MRKTIAVVGALALVQAATAGILINYDAGNAGNGQLMNDITYGGTVYQQGVVVNEGSPSPSHNAFGRTLDDFGGGGYNGGGAGDMTDISNITNNAGIQINNWINYQGTYAGGNSSFGFLENGGRMGEANVAGNGDAFANAGEFFLFSDIYSQAINPSDTVTVSFQGASDNGNANFGVYLLLDGATAGAQIGSNQDGNTTGSPRLTFSSAGFTAASTVQLVIASSNGDADTTRALVDNVYMEVIPEPATIGMVAVFGGALLFIRRRFKI